VLDDLVSAASNMIKRRSFIPSNRVEGSAWVSTTDTDCYQLSESGERDDIKISFPSNSLIDNYGFTDPLIMAINASPAPHTLILCLSPGSAPIPQTQLERIKIRDKLNFEPENFHCRVGNFSRGLNGLLPN
jgi:hypothetical protein